MKKSIILKSFLVILLCAMVLFTIVTPSVYAATDEDFEDILSDDDDTNSSNTNSSNTNSSNTNSSNTNSSNTNTSNTNTNSSNTNSSNTNSSNTNSLPDTGIQDSLPTVLLVVVFAISAIYAYKKIKDYRNID